MILRLLTYTDAGPAGDTPSSARLFDAVLSHCVPVVVSDRIELPFEDALDWTEFAVFITEKRAVQPGYIARQLRAISKERWSVMWHRLKEVGPSPK